MSYILEKIRHQESFTGRSAALHRQLQSRASSLHAHQSLSCEGGRFLKTTSLRCFQIFQHPRRSRPPFRQPWTMVPPLPQLSHQCLRATPAGRANGLPNQDLGGGHKKSISNRESKWAAILVALPNFSSHSPIWWASIWAANCGPHPFFFHFHGAVPIRRTQGERPRPARRRRPRGRHAAGRPSRRRRPSPADATPPATLADAAGPPACLRSSSSSSSPDLRAAGACFLPGVIELLRT